MPRRIKNAVELATELLNKVMNEGLDVSLTIGNREIPIVIHIKLPQQNEEPITEETNNE